MSSPDITQARENLDVFLICFYLLFITKLFGLNDDLVMYVIYGQYVDVLDKV